VAAEQQRAIEIDGRRFAWRALGAGEPLLLINGYAASSADWDPMLLGALARSFEPERVARLIAAFVSEG
jgi:pimeloyl-ACP methyl ester carboxylesterase